MSELSPKSYEDRDVIGAVRLALEASSSAEAARRVVRAIVDRAAATEGRRTKSVELFLDAIKASGCELRVTDGHPRGQIAKTGLTRGRVS